MAQKQNKNTCVIWDNTTYPMTNHFLRGAYIWSKYYIIMATFCWHIIITSDYKLMCRCVQVMEHCILFNVGPYLMMALISLYLIFTNREDHILSRKKCIANQFVDRIILHFH